MSWFIDGVTVSLLYQGKSVMDNGPSYKQLLPQVTPSTLFRKHPVFTVKSQMTHPLSNFNSTLSTACVDK